MLGVVPIRVAINACLQARVYKSFLQARNEGRGHDVAIESK